MKPKTPVAMRELIAQIRQAIPFDMPEAQLCEGCSKGCSMKLLEYLQMEIENWEYRLEQGDIPNFGDLKRLAKSSKKIYKVLQVNGLV